MPASLLVAIYYAPSEDELAHWAISFQDDDAGEEMVLQIIGGDGEDFQFDARETNPISSKSLSSTTLISDNLSKGLEEIYEVLQSTTIQNNNTNFNCQEWVLAGLEDLRCAKVFTTEELEQAKKELEEPRGKKGITVQPL
jgi:hypothetical protein